MEQTQGLGVLTTDRGLIVRSWNGWLARATGLGEVEVQGRPLFELIPSDRSELYREILNEVLEKGTPRVLAPAFHQYLIPCSPLAPSPHFAQMQQRVTVAPLLADTEVVGIIVTIEDMTAALDEQRALAARIDEKGATRDALAVVGAEDWRVRGAAIRVLRQSASSDDIAHLLESLERDHQSLDVLSSALDVLVSANHDVAPALLALLSHSHANMRMHAALALGQLRHADAVPVLIQALGDADANVRFHAIEALGRIGSSAAVEPLSRIAESADFFLSFPAIDALARMDDPRVAPNLVGLLGRDLLRPAIVDTLGAIGDEECVQPLVALLNERRGEASAVASALEHLRARYEGTFGAGEQIVELARAAITREGLRHLVDAITRRDSPLAPLITVSSWIGADATEVLVTLLDDSTVQAEVVNGILAVGRRALMPLVESLERSERAGRLAATDLLGRLGDRRAVPALSNLLIEADAELVAAAIAALAMLGDPRALDRVLPLFGHEHPAVRQAAIAAVNTIGAGSVEPHIRQRLSDSNPRIRECAIRVAGYFGFDSCDGHIIRALDDPDEDVRRAAIEQLPVIDHPQSGVRLRAAIADETPRNRAAAAHAARVADDPSLDGALITALADQEAWVRYFAAGSLGDRRHAAASAPLITLASADPAPHVRIAAMQAAGALDAEAAVPLVQQLLLQDGNEDVAAAALSAVANARNVCIDDLLATAIRSTSTQIRRCAVRALSSRPTMAAVESLAWAGRITDSPDVAAAAIEGLASIGATDNPNVARAAVAALLDIGVEPDRRPGVADALGRQAGGAIDGVAGALRDSRTAARLTAVEALARMRHPRASAALAQALRDDDPAVRAAAITGFGRLGTPSIAAAVAELRNTDPDPAVRSRAAVVCQRYGWTR